MYCLLLKLINLTFVYLGRYKALKSQLQYAENVIFKFSMEECFLYRNKSTQNKII